MATQPRLTTTVVISPLLYVPHSCAVVATLQAAAPLVAKPLIGFTYRATVATFPGAFLLMVSAVALPCACALFAVTWGLKGGTKILLVFQILISNNQAKLFRFSRFSRHVYFSLVLNYS